ncbi:MAG: hypothetical protein WAN22_30650 [Solirubrobacteraceae bacterium]
MNVYVIVFVAPAAIVMLPLSALACASGSVSVEVSMHDTRAVQRSGLEIVAIRCR